MANIITLDLNSPSVQYLRKKDKRLEKVFHMIGPITYEPHTDTPFPFLIHEIIEQMLSVKAGAKIYARLETLCKGQVTPYSIEALSVEDLKRIGTSTAKAKYIKNAASAVLSGTLDFSQFPAMTDEAALSELIRLPGIGMWTAKMYLIFVLNRQDILPFEDVAFLQSYKWLYKTDDISKSSIEKKCKKWKPYSSIAARFLYRALDMGFTKEEFHLYKKGDKSWE
ncbi:DNA-3-methyladenine glycosylase family protein [Megasphaera sp.]|uniref:DNA-3-methyladenine glycosylase family protein n=1 Tax=Megasphaera sp. TaxID=2023260 RepID=UPI00402887B5